MVLDRESITDRQVTLSGLPHGSAKSRKISHLRAILRRPILIFCVSPAHKNAAIAKEVARIDCGSTYTAYT